MTSDAGSFGATEPTNEEGPVPTRAFNPKWQRVFDAIQRKENDEANPGDESASQTLLQRIKKQIRLISIPGFLFGPIYYFYLRMWRKGLLILALLPIIALAETLVHIKSWKLLIPIFCMLYVKQDYYRFCVKGERVWPVLAFSKNIWTDAALVAGTIVVCSIGLAAFDDGSRTDSLKRAQTTSSKRIQTASSTGAYPMINQGRPLSPLQAKFSVMGAGFGPMSAPCSLSREGHEDEDTCEGSHGISYSFSADHKRLWQITRTEQLPSNVSFKDLVEQISAKYGSPSFITKGTGVCQVIWGDASGTSGIGYWVDAKETPCGDSSTGLTVTYKLSDMTEYSNVSRVVAARENAERAAAVASHKF